jgi:hypothetical protein
MSKSREQELLRELDRLAFVVSGVMILILSAVYFIVAEAEGIPSAVREFVLSVTVNLIPIFLIFVASYALFRRIQTIKSDQETDELVGRIVDKVRKVTEKGELLLTSFPGDRLRSEMHKSKELMLLGADLNLTLMRSYPQFTEKLQRKDTAIKVLLVNPDSPACDMAAAMHFEPTSPDDKRRVIHRSLEICRKLKHKAAGKLEVRLLNHLPTFGAFALDPKSPDGVLYLWHYTFKARDALRPKIVLRPADDYWYQFFCEEIATIWDNAPTWQASDEGSVS